MGREWREETGASIKQSGTPTRDYERYLPLSLSITFIIHPAIYVARLSNKDKRTCYTIEQPDTRQQALRLALFSFFISSDFFFIFLLATE